MSGAEVEIELFLAGELTALTVLLRDADLPPEFGADFRKAIANFGSSLRADGQWRGEIKRMRGWDGHANAWDALAAWIKANRPKDAGPWWEVLTYADGQHVDEQVIKFFEQR